MKEKTAIGGAVNKRETRKLIQPLWVGIHTHICIYIHERIRSDNLDRMTHTQADPSSLIHVFTWLYIVVECDQLITPL